MSPAESAGVAPERSRQLAAGSLEALLENARLLHSSLELSELLGSLLRSVMGRLVVSRGLLALVSETEEGVETVAVSRGFRDLPAGSPFDQRSARGAGVEHLLPIGDPDHPIGHLALGQPLGGPPAGQELEFLQALLGIAANAIDNARAHQRARQLNRQLDRRVHQLHTLLDLGRSLTSTLEAPQVAQILGLTLAGQWLLRRYAVIARRSGQPPVARRQGMSFPEPEDLLPQLAQLPGPSLTAALPEGRLRSSLEAQQAVLVVPLRSGEQTFGFVALGEPAGGRGFEGGDLEFLAGLAAQAVVAFENAWYFADAVERQKLERDLALAGEIQQRLFPKELPQPPGFELAAANRPASQVGGDYYDVLPVTDGEDQRLLICVADVSGKGVAASLLMSNMQATLRALLDEEPDLATLVQRTSRLLFDTTPANKYVTAFFLLLDPASGGGSYVNAGHNEGLLLRARGEIEELSSCGLPVGLLGAASYQQRPVELGPGDLVALYTDGVSEANDRQEQELGMDRLKEALASRRSESAQDVVRGVLADVEAFAEGAPQHDDITLLVIKRTA